MSFKACVDALVKTGILVDDSPRHLTREYLWEKAPRGEGHVRIEIREDV